MSTPRRLSSSSYRLPISSAIPKLGQLSRSARHCWAVRSIQRDRSEVAVGDPSGATTPRGTGRPGTGFGEMFCQYPIVVSMLIAFTVMLAVLLLAGHHG